MPVRCTRKVRMQSAQMARLLFGFPPDLQNLRPALGGLLETFDIALLGTCGAVVLALPLAAPAAENVSLSRPVYLVARSSLVLGFVGAGGNGFLILTAMNLFQYRQVATPLILTYLLVIAVERVATSLRSRIR